MNAYLYSGDIVGIFEVSLFAPTPPETPWERNNADNVRFIRNVTTVRDGLSEKEVKSYILTRSAEIHWSPINCRTLRKRWKASVTSDTPERIFSLSDHLIGEFT